MPEKMRAIIKSERAPDLEMALVNVPAVGQNDVLIKVRACSICGTDMHIFRWDPWARSRLKPPLIVGHELCGEVVEIGKGVRMVKTGDFVSAESHIVCGACEPCRTGRAHICQRTQIIGVDRDGCWAEYVCLPEGNLWVNPPEMAPEIACIQENFGNAVHTAFVTDLTAKSVLVTGCGPVGLMTIAVARAAGASTIYATDIAPYRLRLAETMGADLAINVAESDVVRTIHDRTYGEGVDVLLEMSGAAQAINQGFHALKFGGEAALLGLGSAPIPFDMNNHIVFKGATVRGVVGRQLWHTWYRMRELLSSGLVDLGPLITHRFALDDFHAALRVMQSGQSGKVIMYPAGLDATESEGAST